MATIDSVGVKRWPADDHHSVDIHFTHGDEHRRYQVSLIVDSEDVEPPTIVVTDLANEGSPLKVIPLP